MAILKDNVEAIAKISKDKNVDMSVAVRMWIKEQAEEPKLEENEEKEFHTWYREEYLKSK